jgi:hypothetical protein
MNELERLIAGSYGSEDKEFAKHPLDIQRARQALVEANNTHVGFNDYLELHRTFLQNKGCSAEHIEEQLEEVKEISNYFDTD